MCESEKFVIDTFKKDLFLTIFFENIRKQNYEYDNLLVDTVNDIYIDESIQEINIQNWRLCYNQTLKENEYELLFLDKPKVLSCSKFDVNNDGTVDLIIKFQYENTRCNFCWELFKKCIVFDSKNGIVLFNYIYYEYKTESSLNEKLIQEEFKNYKGNRVKFFKGGIFKIESQYGDMGKNYGTYKFFGNCYKKIE